MPAVIKLVVTIFAVLFPALLIGSPITRRIPDQQWLQVRGKVTKEDFADLFKKVAAGNADELTVRRCIYAFDKLLWENSGYVKESKWLPQPEVIHDAKLELKVPDRIRNAPQVVVGRDHPLQVLEDPLVTMRLMYDCRVDASLPVSQLAKRPAADGYPGIIAAGVKTVTRTLNLNLGSYQDIISTGLFAPAGKIVTVTVPEELVAKHYVIQIGHLKQGTPVAKFKTILRAPNLIRKYKISATKTQVASAYGGIIYLLPKPSKNLDVYYNEYVNSDGTYLTDEAAPFEDHIIPVTMEGVVQAPLYLTDRHKPSQLKEILSYPAPTAEIGNERMIITLSSEDLRKHSDIDLAIAVYSDMCDFQGELTGRPVPPPHAYRIVVEPDVAVGGAYAGQPLILNEGWLKYFYASSPTGGGISHEIGHQHQKWAWTYQNGTELTVNIMARYSLEMLRAKYGEDLIPMHPEHTAVALNAKIRRYLGRSLKKRNWEQNPYRNRDLNAFYMILEKEFGWGLFKKVFRHYRAIPMDQWPGGAGKVTGAKKLAIERQRAGYFMVLCSNAAGKNLHPFFENWGVQMAPGYKGKVSHLPDWDFSKWLPSEEGSQ
ncbi:MAG: M60 family metallopeptidase [Verrucomicrobiota bacterium]